MQPRLTKLCNYITKRRIRSQYMEYRLQCWVARVRLLGTAPRTRCGSGVACGRCAWVRIRCATWRITKFFDGDTGGAFFVIFRELKSLLYLRPSLSSFHVYIYIGVYISSICNDLYCMIRYLSSLSFSRQCVYRYCGACVYVMTDVVY